MFIKVYHVSQAAEHIFERFVMKKLLGDLHLHLSPVHPSTMANESFSLSPLWRLADGSLQHFCRSLFQGPILTISNLQALHLQLFLSQHTSWTGFICGSEEMVAALSCRSDKHNLGSRAILEKKLSSPFHPKVRRDTPSHGQATI